VQLPYCIAPALDSSVWDIIGRSLAILWEDWPKNMQLSSFASDHFILNGECPHCRKQAAFIAVAGTFEERYEGWPTRTVGAARCVACNQYILGILRAKSSGSGIQWVYDIHYPVGWPDDTVADEIPDAIKPDFQEALRCRWVKAYNATVEMCRRALEASCIEQGAAPDMVLSKMIDWVHAQGKITTPLQQMAHKVKLGGNRGAHPSDRIITEEDAAAVIEFTREYFQHVYVMPKRMAKFNFDKSKKKP
jgi:hypothetical protein